MGYKNNNYDDYRFEYKNDHILVLKYYTQTKKYAPYTSMLSERNISEETFNKTKKRYPWLALNTNFI